MDDIGAQFERLFDDAGIANWEASLAIDRDKRTPFNRLAADLRAMFNP